MPYNNKKKKFKNWSHVLSKNTQNTIFQPPRNKKLADIIRITSERDAQRSCNTLLKEFSKAKTKSKKLSIMRATKLAANRARASSKRKGLHPQTKHRLEKVARIYDKTYKQMKTQY